MYFISRQGKSSKSDEFRLYKTLNRIMRSTYRTLDIHAAIPKLESGCLFNNLQTIVAFTRQVQRAAKDLKAGPTDHIRSVGLSPEHPLEHTQDTSSLPPSCTQSLVPQQVYDYVHHCSKLVLNQTEPAHSTCRQED